MPNDETIHRIASAAGLHPRSAPGDSASLMWVGQDGFEIGLSFRDGAWSVETFDRGTRRDLGRFADRRDADRFLALRMSSMARTAAGLPAVYVRGFAPHSQWTAEDERSVLTWPHGSASFPRGIGGLNSGREFSWVVDSSLESIAERLKPLDRSERGDAVPPLEPALITQHRLIGAIRSELVTSVGEGVPVRLVVRMLSSTAEPELSDLRVDPPRKIHAPWETLRLARELRSVMWVDGAGTWFTMQLELARSGEVTTTFDYDGEPAWHVEVDPVAYLTDLARYPRAEASWPAWLRARLDEARGSAK